MPVMDGYQATQAIRAFNRKVPIIALTAAVMVEDRDKALAAGMNDHLSKPIDPDSLASLLAQYLPSASDDIAEKTPKNAVKTSTAMKTVLIVASDKVHLKRKAAELQAQYRVKVAEHFDKAKRLLAAGDVDKVVFIPVRQEGQQAVESALQGDSEADLAALRALLTDSGVSLEVDKPEAHDGGE